MIDTSHSATSDTRDENRAAVSGTAAGVPFLAVPPARGAPASAPVVVAWHLLDPPRTEAAFAAALPLRGLDAWRIYLGLPLSGSRLPAGGLEELMALGYEDAVMNIQGPVSAQAVEEFGPALAELRERLGLDTGALGLLGGSLGAAVALSVLAEGSVDASAAVLVSPLVQLRPAVDALGRRYGVEYPWSEPSVEVAKRLDFVARADEIGASGRPPLLLVVGEEDEPEFRDSAAALRDAHRRRGGAAELVTVPGLAHALADEPGIEPERQTPHAERVDRLATEWFRRHLIEAGR